MRLLFDTLAHTDFAMITAIDEVATWLSKRAEETLNLVDSGEFKDPELYTLFANLTSGITTWYA
jgi:hypothetical protein